MSGTPHYMPPEQLDESLRYDPRSDLYGLGVTLYEMIALRNPWESVRTLGDLVKEKRRVHRLDEARRSCAPGSAGGAGKHGGGGSRQALPERERGAETNR